MPSKCPTCGEKTQGKWKYCPECSASLTSVQNFGVVDPMRYLWLEKRDGKFIYDNFEVLRSVGVHPYKTSRIFRKSLGDFSHMYLVILREVSIMTVNPSLIISLYDIGKLLGYYCLYSAAKTTKLDKIINTINRAGILWKIFENDKIRRMVADGWLKNNAAIVSWEFIDKEKNILKCNLDETPFATLNSEKPLFLCDAGAMVGITESLSNTYWNIKKITYTKENPSCEIELVGGDIEKTPELSLSSKEEITNVLNNVVECVVSKKKSPRKQLPDTFHISVDQFMNYMLLSSSPGHAILSKHSGVICGERIAEKAGLSGEDIGFKYARDLFLYLKAGILHEPETRGDGAILLKMDESVYASGVQNIHMKLDVFLAGIIEGLLKKSTSEKWSVEEVKCLANGDDYCEFMCKQVK